MSEFRPSWHHAHGSEFGREWSNIMEGEKMIASIVCHGRQRTSEGTMAIVHWPEDYDAARLIAAAPDLLEALQAVVDLGRSHAKTGALFLAHTGVGDKVAAAIAKATGPLTPSKGGGK